MDLSNVSEYLPVLIAIIGVIALQYFLRRGRGPVSSQRNIVEGLMSDVRINLRLVEVLDDGEQIKHFSVTGWSLYKNKVDFLDQQVQTALMESYELAEDYNNQIATNRKFRSAHYIASINTGKMKERLQKSMSGLEDWMYRATGSTDPNAGHSGFFDSLLGR
jgi:hypothetical protein